MEDESLNEVKESESREKVDNEVEESQEVIENTDEVNVDENNEELDENEEVAPLDDVESKESDKEAMEIEQTEEEKDTTDETFQTNDDEGKEMHETVAEDDSNEKIESKMSEQSTSVKSKASTSTSESPSKSSTDEEEELLELQEKFIATRIKLNYEREKRAYLIKLLIEYFKKKKMDYVLENVNEIKTVKIKQLENYCTKLDAFNELSQKSAAEIEDINYKIEQATNEHDGKVKEINSLTESWLQREKEIGTGLIYAKTGKQISEHTVNDLIKVQRLLLELIEKFRTTLITLEDKIFDIKNELQRLDVVGNIQFLEYEELKMENIAFVDKIEEREEEIERLRKRCQGAIQTLAHVKEKCNALETDKNLLTQQLNKLEEVYNEERAKFNEITKKRDFYRTNSNKMYTDSGLLTQPMLLRDMEESLNEYQVKTEELNRLKEDKERMTKGMRALRKNIERITAEKDVKKSSYSFRI